MRSAHGSRLHVSAWARAKRSSSEYTFLASVARFFSTDARKMLRKKVGLYSRIAMKTVDRNLKAKLIGLRL